MITVTIPTKNRPGFLGRVLRYYASARFPHRILIGDSSDPEQARQTQQLVDAFNDRLTLTYRAYPGLSAVSTVEQLSRLVTTPYSVFVADDDLLCPNALERCMAFLETHPEYVAAHGWGLMLLIEGGQPYGQVIGLKRYPQAVLTAETGAGRLRELFTSSLASLLCSVHRTPVWREMHRGLGQLEGDQRRNIFKEELIQTCLSVVRGKVKELDELHLIRQPHDGTARFPHVCDWIADPFWFPSYQVFRDRLAEALVEQDAISAERALAIVREALWLYLAKEVMTAWCKEQGLPQPAVGRVRKIAKEIPGLRPAWRAIRSRIQRRRVWHQGRDGLSLAMLLDPSCPFHKDFMPVYTLITAPPESTGRPQVAHRTGDVAAAAESGARGS